MVKDSANHVVDQVIHNTIAFELSISVQNVLDSLRKSSKRNRCIISIEKLVKISGYAKSTVQRALKKLKEEKYIIVKHRSSKKKGNLPNCYILK
ncbi:helix-turn-helix domain-containing protein [Thiotrichales bacterium HSG1]|nr:helix-turn-helix domain-containing protein [Thiotrichales bacterium HSG1]